MSRLREEQNAPSSYSLTGMEQLPTFEVAIVGAGPGGLQVAQRLQRARVNYVVLEAANQPGSFFQRYPRHRTLISINKVYMDRRLAGSQRFDWNSLLSDDPRLRFGRFSTEYFPNADVMCRYLADFVARSDLNVQYNARVYEVGRTGDGYTIVTDRMPPITARRIVLAIGLAPYVAPIPGIEHAERYEDYPTAPSGFTDARVLIIGKGNAGFEIANSLISTAAAIHIASPSPARLAWNTHYVGHLRAINNDLIDTYQLKIGNAVLDAEITEIRRDAEGFHVDLTYTHAAGHRVTYNYDRVIVATGFRFAPGPVPGLDLPRCHDDRFPAMTAEYECPTHPGIYYAGNLTHARDYRRTMSGFIHGFRYNADFLGRMLVGVAAHAKVEPDASAVAKIVLDRLTRSDALLLQPGYLADVFTDESVLAHYTAVPLDWVREGGLGLGWRIAVTLEYGPPAPDPLRVDRSPEPAYADATPFLHPVIRILRGTEEVDRLHLLEDLENFYDGRYLARLTSFLKTQLSQRT